MKLQKTIVNKNITVQQNIIIIRADEFASFFLMVKFEASLYRNSTDVSQNLMVQI